jgi:(2R)-3-sulfolactate dehydrogenase (NADP+)
VANSGHCGSLGLFVLPMVRQGLVGLVFSNGPAVMPPWGGHAPVLSTSPLAAGIPTRPRPAIVDLATSAVARGTIAQHQARHEPLQPGWAFDPAGEPTVDPQAALAGMMAPMGGAKGYALAFLVEALTGGLVGPHLAVDVADPLSDGAAGAPQGIGHLALALDPAVVDGDGSSDDRLAALAARVVDAGGRLPGSGRSTATELDDAEPLSLSAPTVGALAQAAEDLGVALPEGWPRPEG